MQRWLRKTTLEKRCQVIPLGQKYWIIFSPQEIHTAFSNSTQVQTTIKRFNKNSLSFWDLTMVNESFQGLMLYVPWTKALKEGKVQAINTNEERSDILQLTSFLNNQFRRVRIPPFLFFAQFWYIRTEYKPTSVPLCSNVTKDGHIFLNTNNKIFLCHQIC